MFTTVIVFPINGRTDEQQHNFESLGTNSEGMCTDENLKNTISMGRECSCQF